MKALKGVEPVPLFVGWAVAPNPWVDAPNVLAGCCVVVELPNPPKLVVAGLAAPNIVLPPALPEPNPVALEVAPPKGDDVAAWLPNVPDDAPPPKMPPVAAGAPKAGLLAEPKGADVAVALLDAPNPRSMLVSKRVD